MEALRLFLCTQKALVTWIWFTIGSKSVREHFSFAKIFYLIVTDVAFQDSDQTQ